MRRAIALVLLVSAALVLGACGAESSDDMTPAAATELGNAVKQIRTSIEGGDRQRAAAQITSLRSAVSELVTTGAITPARAIRVNNAINAVSDQLGTVVASTSTTKPSTTTSSTSTTTATTTTIEGKKGKGNND
jgi:ribosomal protein S20